MRVGRGSCGQGKHDIQTAPMSCLHVDETMSGGKSHAGKGVDILVKADMTCTFEFVLHFVLEVQPNQNIIIISMSKLISQFRLRLNTSKTEVIYSSDL